MPAASLQCSLQNFPYSPPFVTIHTQLGWAHFWFSVIDGSSKFMPGEAPRETRMPGPRPCTPHDALRSQRVIIDSAVKSGLV